MMAALGLDVGAHLSAEERFKQVAAVMKKRDLQDRKQQKELRRQQKLEKKVCCCFCLVHRQPMQALRLCLQCVCFERSQTMATK